MQLKLDRSEYETGIFRKRVEYKLSAALLVTPEEREQITRHNLWKMKVRPLKDDEKGHYDLEVLDTKTFKHLVEGFTTDGSLSWVESVERWLLKGCERLKERLEGGQAGERIIDI